MTMKLSIHKLRIVPTRYHRTNAPVSITLRTEQLAGRVFGSRFSTSAAAVGASGRGGGSRVCAAHPFAGTELLVMPNGNVISGDAVRVAWRGRRARVSRLVSVSAGHDERRARRQVRETEQAIALPLPLPVYAHGVQDQQQAPAVGQCVFATWPHALLRAQDVV